MKIYNTKTGVLWADIIEKSGRLIVRGFLGNTPVLQRQFPLSQLEQAKTAADDYSNSGFLATCK